MTIAPAGTWELDAVHSAVGFEVEYLGGTFKGSFREIAATLVVGDDSVSLEGSAKVASVDVKDENLAGHLQSPDFFDAERYPEIRFTAKDVSLDGETVKVEGDLTIKGVTHAADVTRHRHLTADRPVRPRADRAQARHARRPHPVRRQLEQPAPERRSGSRERRHRRRRAVLRQVGLVTMKILAISGSLRADSLNTKLLHAAGELADGEVEFEVWDGLKAVPPYDQDDEDGTPPLAVARLRSAIAEADAVLFATPEYNASIPGQLKNALDWVSRPMATNPLRNVPVAVIGASPGAFGAVWAQAELKKVVGLIGARVLPDRAPRLQGGHSLRRRRPPDRRRAARAASARS